MIWVIIFSENLNVNDPLDGLYDPINRHKLPLAHVDVHPALKEACDDYISFSCVWNQPLGAHFLKIFTVPPPAMARARHQVAVDQRDLAPLEPPTEKPNKLILALSGI